MCGRQIQVAKVEYIVEAPMLLKYLRTAMDAFAQTCFRTLEGSFLLSSAYVLENTGIPQDLPFYRAMWIHGVCISGGILFLCSKAKPLQYAFSYGVHLCDFALAKILVV